MTSFKNEACFVRQTTYQNFAIFTLTKPPLMKKILTLICFAFQCAFSQTALYSNDFTAGGGGWTLGQGGNFDFWTVNNVYSCSSTTPNAGGGNYMHIYDDLFSDMCAHSGFLGSGSGGTVYSTMTSGINTSAASVVTITFDWLCQGQTGPVLSSFGFVDYSVDGGMTWTNITSPLAKYNGQPTWTSAAITSTQVPALANQADLRLRFGFTNSGYGTNPAFAVDNIVVVDAITAGIAEQEANSFTLFPNPTEGIFTVSNVSAAADAQTIVVTDALGRTVLQQPAGTNGATVIDLTGKEKGMYFVRLIGGENAGMKKVILR
jgi:hypothetical protein